MITILQNKLKNTFKTAKESLPTKLTVTYYDDSDPSVENRPKVSFEDTIRGLEALFE